ncbi:MAG: GNAT family N-acetyltransferase [Anaerolineales bacterium]|nr:GNAT family N-acetyltransferase [Anaerolineales bacterium]
MTDHALIVRAANSDDRRQLANLIHFGPYVHRHLDWRPPLEWIGNQPFLVAESSGRIVAALACPPDAQAIAWIRLFVVGAEANPDSSWDRLWPDVWQHLPSGVERLAAMPMQDWFARLLGQKGFLISHQIMLLSYKLDALPPQPELGGFRIRLMNHDDLSTVQALDTRAFDPVWRNSLDLLEIAFSQAAIATVAEDDERDLVGYQISTASAAGGHLARLAVQPEAQARGIGYALVRDLLCQFQRRGALSVTVNTQSDNRASLSLYERAGFVPTGDLFPVYQWALPSD